MKVSVKRIAGDEADHLLVQSDRYMAALYPAESNHLVSSASLRGRHALFLGAFTDQATRQYSGQYLYRLRRSAVLSRCGLCRDQTLYLLMKATEGTP